MQLPGVEEDVGMIGIHWRGQFIEMVPWNGEVQASSFSASFSLQRHLSPMTCMPCPYTAKKQTVSKGLY